MYKLAHECRLHAICGFECEIAVVVSKCGRVWIGLGIGEGESEVYEGTYLPTSGGVQPWLQPNHADAIGNTLPPIKAEVMTIIYTQVLH